VAAAIGLFSDIDARGPGRKKSIDQLCPTVADAISVVKQFDAKRLALPGAWLAGFVFALHPVCVEAVAWMSEQKSTLSGVLFLGAALLYLKFDESRRRLDYVLALTLFLAALAAKTVTATLPAALLVILWWRRGALRWKEDVAPLAPWLAVGATAAVDRIRGERLHRGARDGIRHSDR
jgi:hypothetical protein